MLDLEPIKKRLEAASEPPWQDEITNDGDIVVHIPRGHDVYLGGMEGTCPACFGNQEFIAHARQDIPNLVAEVERLREENAELQKAYDLAYRRPDDNMTVTRITGTVNGVTVNYPKEEQL